MPFEQDLDTFSRTLYGEGRGEYTKPDGGLAALIAIANVVMNRVKQKSWFGKTIRDVCLKPWQFSCWNKDDPNYPIILAVTKADPLFEICHQVATAVSDDRWPDLTKGSDHYFSSILQVHPKWAQNRLPNFRLGRHQFYKLGA